MSVWVVLSGERTALHSRHIAHVECGELHVTHATFGNSPSVASFSNRDSKRSLSPSRHPPGQLRGGGSNSRLTSDLGEGVERDSRKEGASSDKSCIFGGHCLWSVTKRNSRAHLHWLTCILQWPPPWKPLHIPSLGKRPIKRGKDRIMLNIQALESESQGSSADFLISNSLNLNKYVTSPLYASISQLYSGARDSCWLIVSTR